MNIHALNHIQFSNYAYAYNHNTLHIRLRTAKGDMKKVDICYGCKFDWKAKKAPMVRAYCDEYFDYYEYELSCEDSRVGYYFELTDTKGAFKIFTEVGLIDEFDDSQAYCTFFQCPYINSSDIHVKPNWVDDAVFYQIFVDRFNKGQCDNVRDDLVPWDAEPTPTNYFGGNLQGIIDKLDYLEDLGINAIYLTPIFESISNHKYDISDYMKIDKYFGDKETMCQLVKQAHNRGIRIILDAVFNHCSMDISFFQDVLKLGKKSKYKDWFVIHNYPVSVKKANYETFGFCNYMPKLNTENEGVKEFLFSVVRYWSQETGIDGWRLDVADEVNRGFWRDFRKVVKEIDENMIVIGESWHIALDWLKGDMFDGVMNYPVTKLMLDYFTRKCIDSEMMAYKLSNHIVQYSQTVNECMLNLLDSHDTERFLTSTKGNIDQLLAATTFLYGYRGMPCVYYGTEIGMDGAYDPGCRKGFDWNRDNWNKKVYDFYKKIINIRKSEIALKKGTVEFDYNKEVFVMKRQYKREVIYVIANASDEAVTVDLNLLFKKTKRATKKAEFKELISSKCRFDSEKGIVEIMPDGAGYYKK